MDSSVPVQCAMKCVMFLIVSWHGGVGLTNVSIDSVWIVCFRNETAIVHLRLTKFRVFLTSCARQSNVSILPHLAACFSRCLKALLYFILPVTGSV